MTFLQNFSFYNSGRHAGIMHFQLIIALRSLGRFGSPLTAKVHVSLFCGMVFNQTQVKG